MLRRDAAGPGSATSTAELGRAVVSHASVIGRRRVRG